MTVWALASMVIIFIATAAATTRFWLRSARTKRLPEFSFASAATLLATGFLGWVASASLASSISEAARSRLSAAAVLLIALGASWVLVGTWRFYRPASRLAGLFSVASSLTLVAAWVVATRGGEPIELSHPSAAPVILALGQTGCFFWWGIESLLYHGKMKRRAQIGLVEPIECERFRLLGFGSLLIAGALALVPLSGWVLGSLPREVPALLAAIILLTAGGVLGLLSGLFAPHLFHRSPPEHERRSD
jgi:hypothetical protein